MSSRPSERVHDNSINYASDGVRPRMARDNNTVNFNKTLAYRWRGKLGSY